MSDTAKHLSIESVRESKWNPRRHYDAAAMRELTESIKLHGITTPLLVRPVQANGQPAGYEIAAGHRRLKAAKEAGLTALPAVVREMDDDTFRELLTVENLQREDVHPLEEAHAYKAMLKAKVSVAELARRMSKSEPYVYDRLGLLKLIDEAQTLFEKGEIPVGHAVLLSRLKPKDQKRAIDPGAMALFVPEHSLNRHLFNPKKNPYKVVSLAEFKAWIEKRTRFDRKSVDAFLFPDTAKKIEEAAKQKHKAIIPITLDHSVVPDAKDGKERTYSLRSWARADGREELPETFRKGKSKTCENAVLGVFVVGHRQGETMEVCVARPCPVHRPAGKKKKASAESKAKEAETKQAAEWERKNQIAEMEAKRWEKAWPQIKPLVSAATDQDSLKVGSPGWLLLADKYRPAKGGAEVLVRFLLYNKLCDELEWGGRFLGSDSKSKQLKQLRAFGIEKQVKEILKNTEVAAPKAEEEEVVEEEGDE